MVPYAVSWLIFNQAGSSSSKDLCAGTGICSNSPPFKMIFGEFSSARSEATGLRQR
jgi:hypothetical protein